MPSQQLALCTAAQDTGQCFCVIGGGALPSVNEFLSHSINHSGQTGERVTTLTLLSRTLLLNVSHGPEPASLSSPPPSVRVSQ